MPEKFAEIGDEGGENIIDSLTTTINDNKEKFLSAIRDLISDAKDEFEDLPIIGSMDGSHRTGLNEVPYDGYQAVLHKGEMVLTQPEANRYRKGENRVVQAQPTTVETNVNVEFTGSLAALGRVLQPIIKKEEKRIGKALVGGAY